MNAAVLIRIAARVLFVAVAVAGVLLISAPGALSAIGHLLLLGLGLIMLGWMELGWIWRRATTRGLSHWACIAADLAIFALMGCAMLWGFLSFPTPMAILVGAAVIGLAIVRRPRNA